jgi:hypothetical protein
MNFWDRRIIYLKEIDQIWSLNFDPPLRPITTRSIFTLGIFAFFGYNRHSTYNVYTKKLEYYGVESKGNLKRI